MVRVKPHTKHLIFKDNLIEFPFQQHILSHAGRRTPEEIYLQLLDVLKLTLLKGTEGPSRTVCGEP